MPNILIPFLLTIIALLFVRFEKDLALSLFFIRGIQLFFAFMGKPREYVYYGGYVFFFMKSLTFYQTKEKTHD